MNDAEARPPDAPFPFNARCGVYQIALSLFSLWLAFRSHPAMGWRFLFMWVCFFGAFFAGKPFARPGGWWRLGHGLSDAALVFLLGYWAAWRAGSTAAAEVHGWAYRSIISFGLSAAGTVLVVAVRALRLWRGLESLPPLPDGEGTKAFGIDLLYRKPARPWWKFYWR